MFGPKCKTSVFFKTVSSLQILTLLVFFALPPRYVQAQTVSVLNLPVPGTMVTASEKFVPPLVRGLTLHAENPLAFDFIIDPGNAKLNDDELKTESEKLIKYFLASLTIPEEDLWVNLSPYEKSRIIPDGFGETEMGRDLLAQDYVLKQLSASLIYPEKDLGKDFWSKIYAKAKAAYGTTDIPVNTFNKVWIVPEKATILETDTTAFIVKSRLKVMLESDYVALDKNRADEVLGTDRMEDADIKQVNDISSAIVKEIVLPEIEREVNEGKNFAMLRQIYNSLLLAVWFKHNLKDNLINQVYSDQAKISGVDVEDKTIKEQIYQQYLAAYRKGVFNYIKEDADAATGEAIPRKYFSGGAALENTGTVIRDQALNARTGSGKTVQNFIDEGAVERAQLSTVNPNETFKSVTAVLGSRSDITDGNVGKTDAAMLGLDDAKKELATIQEGLPAELGYDDAEKSRMAGAIDGIRSPGQMVVRISEVIQGIRTNYERVHSTAFPEGEAAAKIGQLRELLGTVSPVRDKAMLVDPAAISLRGTPQTVGTNHVVYDFTDGWHLSVQLENNRTIAELSNDGLTGTWGADFDYDGYSWQAKGAPNWESAINAINRRAAVDLGMLANDVIPEIHRVLNEQGLGEKYSVVVRDSVLGPLVNITQKDQATDPVVEQEIGALFSRFGERLPIPVEFLPSDSTDRYQFNFFMANKGTDFAMLADDVKADLTSQDNPRILRGINDAVNLAIPDAIPLLTSLKDNGAVRAEADKAVNKLRAIFLNGITRYARQLASTNEIERQQAIKALAEAGSARAIPDLLSFIRNNRNTPQSAEAAKALQQIRSSLNHRKQIFMDNYERFRQAAGLPNNIPSKAFNFEAIKESLSQDTLDNTKIDELKQMFDKLHLPAEYSQVEVRPLTDEGLETKRQLELLTDLSLRRLATNLSSDIPEGLFFFAYQAFPPQEAHRVIQIIEGPATSRLTKVVNSPTAYDNRKPLSVATVDGRMELARENVSPLSAIPNFVEVLDPKTNPNEFAKMGAAAKMNGEQRFEQYMLNFLKERDKTRPFNAGYAIGEDHNGFFAEKDGKLKVDSANKNMQSIELEELIYFVDHPGFVPFMKFFIARLPNYFPPSVKDDFQRLSKIPEGQRKDYIKKVIGLMPLAEAERGETDPDKKIQIKDSFYLASFDTLARSWNSKQKIRKEGYVNFNLFDVVTSRSEADDLEKIKSPKYMDIFNEFTKEWEAETGWTNTAVEIVPNLGSAQDIAAKNIRNLFRGVFKHGYPLEGDIMLTMSMKNFDSMVSRDDMLPILRYQLKPEGAGQISSYPKPLEVLIASGENAGKLSSAMGDLKFWLRRDAGLDVVNVTDTVNFDSGRSVIRIEYNEGGQKKEAQVEYQAVYGFSTTAKLPRLERIEYQVKSGDTSLESKIEIILDAYFDELKQPDENFQRSVETTLKDMNITLGNATVVNTGTGNFTADKAMLSDEEFFGQWQEDFFQISKNLNQTAAADTFSKENLAVDELRRMLGSETNTQDPVSVAIRTKANVWHTTVGSVSEDRWIEIINKDILPDADFYKTAAASGVQVGQLSPTMQILFTQVKEGGKLAAWDVRALNAALLNAVAPSVFKQESKNPLDWVPTMSSVFAQSGGASYAASRSIRNRPVVRKIETILPILGMTLDASSRLTDLERKSNMLADLFIGGENAERTVIENEGDKESWRLISARLENAGARSFLSAAEVMEYLNVNYNESFSPGVAGNDQEFLAQRYNELKSAGILPSALGELSFDQFLTALTTPENDSQRDAVKALFGVREALEKKIKDMEAQRSSLDSGAANTVQTFKKDMHTLASLMGFLEGIASSRAKKPAPKDEQKDFAMLNDDEINQFNGEGDLGPTQDAIKENQAVTGYTERLRQRVREVSEETTRRIQREIRNNPSFVQESQTKYGGIDLNPANLKVEINKRNGGVNVQYDPKLIEELREKGIDGFVPYIINVQPMPSIMPLLGASSSDEAPMQLTKLNLN